MDNIYANRDLGIVLKKMSPNGNVNEAGILWTLQLLFLEFMVREQFIVRKKEYTKQGIQAQLIQGIKEFKEQSKQLCEAIDCLGAYEADEKCLIEAAIELENLALYKSEASDMAEMLCRHYLIEQYYPESITPDWMNKLAVELICPVTGSFYDGTAGAGKTVNEAQRYAHKQGGELEICGQEKNPVLFAVSVILAAMQGRKKYHFRCGDVFSDPAFIEEKQMRRFDYSVMFCPTKSESYRTSVFENDRYQRFAAGFRGGSNMDWMFAQHQLSFLKEEGKGVISMFSGSLFNGQYSDIRKNLIDRGAIKCVISLPPNILPSTSIPVNLVVFEKNTDHAVFMIDAEKILKKHRSFHYGEKSDMPEEVIQEIVAIYNAKEEQEQVSRWADTKILEDGILYPPKYIEKASINTELFGKVYVDTERFRREAEHYPRMEEIGGFYRGINTSLSVERAKDGEVRIVKLADVQDGKLFLEQAERYRCKENVKTERYRVHAGDLLFSCKGPSVKMCIVPPHEGVVLISQTFIGFRMDTGKGLPEYVKYFFESPVGQCLLKSRQLNSSIVMLNPKDLASIPVNLPSVETQSRIVDEMKKRELEIEELTKHIEQLKRKKEITYFQESGIEQWIRFEDTKEE